MRFFRRRNDGAIRERFAAEALERRSLLSTVAPHSDLGSVDGDTAILETLAPFARKTPTASSVFTGQVVVTLAKGADADVVAKALGAKHQLAYAGAGGQHLWSVEGADASKILKKLKSDSRLVDAYAVYADAAPTMTLMDQPMADQAESEPNNTAAAANAVSVSSTPNTISAAISGGTDVDFYSFTLPARSGVFFDIDAREIGLSASLDTVLTVYDSTGAVVQGANNNGRDFDDFTLNDTSATAVSADSSLYLDLNAGSYVVRVSSNSSTSGSYQLKLTSDSSYTASPPAFNSLAGATDTLYLDFDGHSATDSWGTYTVAPYDISGNAAEWTPLERLAIKTVWQRVAEDYSPFNINISTSYGGSFNDGVGFRQVIGNSTGSEFGYGAGTIGVAFLNSYASGGSNNNTAFTFALNFSAQQSTESTTGGMASDMALARATEMANTSAHEFGHALGLKHYGGTNPQLNAIMHSPDFGLNRERWVSGNTKSDEPPVISQDDVAVISNGTNTFGYRADDVGNTRPAATVLSSGTGSYTASGVIHQVSDSDYFRFSGFGNTTINLTMLERAGNLDGTILLYDSGGTLLSSANGASLSATMTISLPVAGNYYVEVRSNTAVGSIGQYGLMVNTTLPGSGVISGRTFRDANLNHVYEPAGGDAPLAGVLVYLDMDNDAVIDVGEPTATTDASGNYSFTSLPDGSYTVRENQPLNYVTNKTYTALVSGGGTVANQDFGNFPLLYTGGAAAESFTVRLSAADNTRLEIINALAGLTYTAPAALVPSLSFSTGDNSDALIVDYINGSPVPSGGISFDGQNQSDTLSIVGTASAEAYIVGSSSVTRGSDNIGYGNVESVSLSAGGGADNITVQALGAPVTLNIDAGIGDDVIAVGIGDLGALDGPVVVNGGGDNDAVTINDFAIVASDSYTITAGALSRLGFGGVSWAAVETLNLNAEKGDNAINLNGAPAATLNVDGRDGWDHFIINAAPIAPITFAGGFDFADFDQVTVNAGTYTFDADAYPTTMHLIVNVNTGGNVVFNASQHLENLNVNGGVATVTANGSRFINTGNVIVGATGRLDLKDNDLIVRSGSIGGWNGSQYTGITRLLQSGRGAGAWDGYGIATSMSDATSGVLTTLAIATAGDLGIDSFDNESVAPGAVLVKYTWGGDANLDGELTGDDYFRIDSHILQSGSVFGHFNGDFDFDGELDGDDYFIIDSNIIYAQNSPPL